MTVIKQNKWNKSCKAWKIGAGPLSKNWGVTCTAPDFENSVC